MQWLDEDFADSCDFELIGLSSHLPPHRLSWALNQHLEWRFRFSHVMEIPQRSGTSKHAVYRFVEQDDAEVRTFYLVENKVQGGTIARFQGGAVLDYVIQIMDEFNSIEDAIARMRGVKGINYIQALDPLQSGAIEHLALIDLSETAVD
jgi:hypothetical protein